MVKSILNKLKKKIGGNDDAAEAKPAAKPAPQQKEAEQPKPAKTETKENDSRERKPRQNHNRSQNKGEQEKAEGGEKSSGNGQRRSGNRSGQGNRNRRGGQNRRGGNKSKNADELMQTVKQQRGKQEEEWRPSQAGTAESSEGKAESDQNERRQGNRGGKNRRRRSGGQNRRSEGDGEKGSSGEQRRSGNRNRKGGEGRGRGRGHGEGRKASNKPTPARGKGFNFPRKKEEHGDWDPASFVAEPEEGKTRFTDLDLAPEVLHAIADLGYKYCTPIQAGVLPTLLTGQDGIGQAQTGTGKTAAFLLASLTRMLQNPQAEPKNGRPRMLILAPTRELVIQIEEEAAELAKYTPIQSLPVYGGLDYEPQKEALRNNVVDLVVATPGRLIDFLRSKVIDLSGVETLVLDEADRMLDMGFIPDVKRIVYATPHKDKRQTLFFSATFTDAVKRLADSWTRDAISVEIAPENVAADTVEQTVYIVTEDTKFALVVNLLRNLEPKRCLIFANRRDRSQELCDRLKDYEFESALLTGAVPQARRVKVLERFKTGDLKVLVATDVAGRGIHVDDVDLVINFNLPDDPEDYVHRIGRTGRAGTDGKSICFACEFDSMMIPEIETYLGRELKCTQPEEEWTQVEDRPRTHVTKSRSSGGGGGRGSGRGRPRGPRGGGRRGGPRRR